jgi:hypothetical protein
MPLTLRSLVLVIFCSLAPGLLGAQSLRLGAWFGPELSVGMISTDPPEMKTLWQRGNVTQSYGIQFRAEMLPFLGIETGTYLKARSSRELDQNAQAGLRVSSHYQYHCIPLRLRVNWKECFFSVGPSMEILQNAYSLFNGQASPAIYPTSRSIELGAGFQLGLETPLNHGIHAFIALQGDVQWLRALRINELRHMSLGLVIGFNWGQSSQAF